MPAPYGDVVACSWHGEAGWSRSLHVMPDGCVDISWDGTAVTVTPAAEVARRVVVVAGSSTVGVRLRPAAAGAIVGPLVAELRGPAALGDVWGAAPAARLELELAGLPVDAVRQRLLAAVLERAQRMPDRRLTAAVERLARPTTSVEDAAAAVGWSVRQLRRRCVADVGLAPKPLQQVLRFQRALRTLGTEPLARIAADQGYADQAHLTRAVRRHAGATPRQLAAAMGRAAT